MAAVATATRSTRAQGAYATRTVIVAGLVVGAVLGFGGNFLTGTVQSISWALSAMGLIVAAVALALRSAAASRPLAAIGFVVLALGETRVLNPTDAPGGEGSFAAGALLYAPALILIALSGWPSLWVRLVGALAGLLFGAHAVLFLAGAAVDSTGPVAAIGYMLLTITIIGWIIAVLREPTRGRSNDPSGILSRA